MDQVAGQPIAFWTSPNEAELPLFLSAAPGSDMCSPIPGGCASVCTQSPASCDPAACRALMLDSLAPLSTLVHPEIDAPFYAKGCALLKSPPGSQVGAERTRLRIFDLGALYLPQSSIAADAWQVDDKRHISGVLGGDFLLQFASEFRFEAPNPPSVRFFRRLPGSEEDLARSGLSFISSQSPGQFLGRMPGDQCELAPGLECDRPIAGMSSLETQTVMPPSRLQLDACMTPPSCTLIHQEDDRCRLQGWKQQTQPCQDWRAAGASGASLLLATAVPGIVLFSDSAARILPDPASIPLCNRYPKTADAASGETPPRYCLESETGGSLALAGWPRLTGLKQLRMSSLALLSGGANQFDANPCERWQRRMQALQSQCEALALTPLPSYPDAAVFANPQLAVTLERSMFQSGELVKDLEKAERIASWLPLTIVPSTAPVVRNLRRSSGSFAVQADGLVGLAAFSQSQLILDYTERDAPPGIRVRCLHPEEGRCRSIPSCNDERGPDPSCCFGLGQEQLIKKIRSSAPDQLPHPCCVALSEASARRLAKENPALCGALPVADPSTPEF